MCKVHTCLTDMPNNFESKISSGDVSMKVDRCEKKYV